jgi:hypothetical protein
MNRGPSQPLLIVPPSSEARSSVPRPAGRTRFRTVAILVSCVLFPVLAGGADAPTNPAVNWVLPLFTDQDGFRSMTLRGATVRPAGENTIAVTDLNITIFSGTAAARVETVLLSQKAMFYSRQNRATGTNGVRVIRDELEVNGLEWSYDHAGKKVSIRKNVRVVYHAPLKIKL